MSPADSIGKVLEDAKGHYNIGRLDEAERLYQKVLQADPDHLVSLLMLGIIAFRKGNNDAAIVSLNKAIAIKPDYAEAHGNLGTVLFEAGRFDEAVASYRSFIEIKPGIAEAHFNLGNAYIRAGRPDEAIASYKEALAIKPEFAHAHFNLGNAYKDSEQLNMAIDSYRNALAVGPDNYEAHNNIGNAYKDLRQFDEAVTCYRNALAIKPDCVEAYGNLGAAYTAMGLLEEAIQCLQKALVLNPGSHAVTRDLVHQLRHVCDWPEVNKLEPVFREIIKNAIKEDKPIDLGSFDNISSRANAAENFAIARLASREIVENVIALNPGFSMSGRQKKKKRLTLGYLSSDFRHHPMTHLLFSFFEQHDRNRFEVLTFSHGPDDKSVYRKQVIDSSDRFFDISGVGTLDAAELIYNSGVDILIDLNGHTQNHRMEICALRPAPLQVAYMGFPGTSGSDFLDYVITDRIVTPENQSPYYSEEFLYMPHCYMVTDDRQLISGTPCTRSECGLPEDGFVFCSFNATYKIEPVMFDVWMNLLKKTPGSVLWVFRSNELAERNLRREAQARHVDADRLVFADRVPKEQHLSRLQLADLILDTRIYGGHTTTVDSLWAGIPVVASLGGHFASRVSSSVLTAIGLEELITTSMEEFEALALRLSQNPKELAGLKEKLADNRLTYPLFDTARFVRNLESGYQEMWSNYAEGKRPSRIDVCEASSP